MSDPPRIHVWSCLDPEEAWFQTLSDTCEREWEEWLNQMDLEYEAHLATREADMFWARESVDPWAPEDRSLIQIRQQVFDTCLLWPGSWDVAEVGDGDD